MIFKDIWVLFFLPLLVVYVYFLKRRDVRAAMRFSSGALLKGARPTWRTVLAANMVYARAAVIALVLFALARPRVPIEEARVETEGIDIVLAIDASGSMLAEDFTIGGRRVNRLEVVKGVVEDFIRERKDDRIGMIAFAARAYTVCPLTLDYDWLIENLKRVEIGAIEDGTAIGSAISSSLNSLKNTKAKSKVVILLTDGVNNAGKIAPLTAAEAAKTLGIKIYTIGAGTKGMVPFPARNLWGQKVYQRVKIEIDEKTLKEIAKKTGGRYFRATDTESLQEIYDEINDMETTPIAESGYREYQELFGRFLLLGLMIFLVEVVLTNTILKKLP